MSYYSGHRHSRRQSTSIMAWPHYVSPKSDMDSREVHTSPPTPAVRLNAKFSDWRTVSICCSFALAIAMSLFMTDLLQHARLMSWRTTLAASVGVGVVSLLWLWKANPNRALQRAFVMSSLMTVGHLTASQWGMDFVFYDPRFVFKWSASEPSWTVVGLIVTNIAILVALVVESKKT